MDNFFNEDFKQQAQKTASKDRKKLATRIVLWSIIVIVLIILVTSSLFTVDESEQAVIVQFGAVKEIIVSPDNSFIDNATDLMNTNGAILNNVIITRGKGLFLRIPFVTEVKKYQSRLFTYVSNKETVHTIEKKQYEITMFAQWRIANPGLFYITQGVISNAEKRLDDLIYPTIIQRINQLDADELISDKAKLNESLASGLISLNKEMRDSGIEIDDIQISSTMLPEGNLQTTYEKMIANRAKVAQQLRSEGAESYVKAVADADRESRVIEADAIEQSEKTKGEGDAQALSIYAQAYAKDTEFYSFWRSLKAMESALDGSTTLVLDKNHPLWKQILDWATPSIDFKE
jgi:membrane protease subunit HflC